MLIQRGSCLLFLLLSTFTAAHTDSIDTRTGHTGYVNAIAFSPNGIVLASGSDDQTVKLWSLANGKEIRTIDTNGGVEALAFSPDGKNLATGVSIGELILWDVSTGKESHRFETGNCHAVVFSPDGKLIACGDDEKVTLVDVETGAESVKLDKAHSPVVFNPNGKQLITASGDDLIRVWDVKTGERVQTIEDVGKVSTIVVSANGLFMACANQDETKSKGDVEAVKLFNLINGRIVRTFKSEKDNTRPVTIAFSPDNKSLALGYSLGYSSKGSGIKITNALTGTLVSEIGASQTETSDQDLESENDAEEMATRELVYSRDGRYLASVKAGGKSIYLWSVATSKKLNTLEGHSIAVESIAFSLDDKSLFSGGDEGAIIKWDVTTGKVQKLFSQIKSSSITKLGVTTLAISADGKTLAVTSGPQFHLLDLASGSEPRANKLTVIGSLLLSPDLKYAASMSDIITLYDPASGEEVRKLLPQTTEPEPITAVSFSPDVRNLAGVTKQGIKVWDLGTGRVVRTLRGTFSYGNTVKYSPDSKLIACGCDQDGRDVLKIWDATTGVLQHSLENQGKVFAFSPDSKRLATLESLEAINLFEVGTGKQISIIKYVGFASVTALAFSHDGKLLALASEHGIKLFDVASGKELRTLARNPPVTQPFSSSAEQSNSLSSLIVERGR